MTDYGATNKRDMIVHSYYAYRTIHPDFSEGLILQLLISIRQFLKIVL